MPRKNNIEIASIKPSEIIIKGNNLNICWLDSYILISSKKDHPHED